MLNFVIFKFSFFNEEKANFYLFYLFFSFVYRLWLFVAQFSYESDTREKQNMYKNVHNSLLPLFQGPEGPQGPLGPQGQTGPKVL